jgi:hypothetical protein
VLVFVPERVENAFYFKDLPGGVSYIIGLWGCGLATMSLGYVAAARNPVRHIAWIQVGIARGAAEFAFGLVCIARGLVTFRQAALGILVAGLMALGYVLLYPRKPRLVPGPATAGPETKTA